MTALMAGADVKALKDLTPEHLHAAAQALKDVLLSDQSLGVGVEKAFARAAMSQLFPNSELVNPSNWRGKIDAEKAASVRRKFETTISEDLKRAVICLKSESGKKYVCTYLGKTDTNFLLDGLEIMGAIQYSQNYLKSGCFAGTCWHRDLAFLTGKFEVSILLPQDPGPLPHYILPEFGLALTLSRSQVLIIE